jgi:hypothetical protein
MNNIYEIHNIQMLCVFKGTSTMCDSSEEKFLFGYIDDEDAVIVEPLKQKQKEIRKISDDEGIIVDDDTTTNNEICDKEVSLVLQVDKYLKDVHSAYKSNEKLAKQYLTDFGRMCIYYNNVKQEHPQFIFKDNHSDSVSINDTESLIKFASLSNVNRILLSLITQASYPYVYEMIFKYYSLDNHDKVLIHSRKDDGLIYNIVKNKDDYDITIMKTLCICKPSYEGGFFVDYEVYKTLDIEISITLCEHNSTLQGTQAASDICNNLPCRVDTKTDDVHKHGVLSWNVR